MLVTAHAQVEGKLVAFVHKLRKISRQREEAFRTVHVLVAIDMPFDISVL
jgi:hypothetical protein